MHEKTSDHGSNSVSVLWMYADASIIPGPQCFFFGGGGRWCNVCCEDEAMIHSWRITPDSVANSIPQARVSDSTVEVLFTCSFKHMYWTSGPTGELCGLVLNAYTCSQNAIRACSAGRKWSWIIYCWLVWCERKILFQLIIHDRIRASEQADVVPMFRYRTVNCRRT